MPSSRFSRRTVLAAIDVLLCLKHSDFDRYIREFGSDFTRRVPGPGVSLRTRLNGLIDLVDQDPNQMVNGRLLHEELVEKAVSLFPPTPQHPWEQKRLLNSDMQAFQRMLELDGFAVSDQAIRRSLPIDIGLPEAQNEITKLLSNTNGGVR